MGRGEHGTAKQQLCLRCGEAYLVQRLGHVRGAILVGPGEGVGEVLGLHVVLRARDDPVLVHDAVRGLLLLGPDLSAGAG